ncbi:MAG: hypothetical protein V4642_13810 [Bacteroidota bacterium]
MGPFAFSFFKNDDGALGAMHKYTTRERAEVEQFFKKQKAGTRGAFRLLLSLLIFILPNVLNHH